MPCWFYNPLKKQDLFSMYQTNRHEWWMQWPPKQNVSSRWYIPWQLWQSKVSETSDLSPLLCFPLFVNSAWLFNKHYYYFVIKWKSEVWSLSPSGQRVLRRPGPQQSNLVAHLESHKAVGVTHSIWSHTKWPTPSKQTERTATGALTIQSTQLLWDIQGCWDFRLWLVHNGSGLWSRLQLWLSLIHISEPTRRA